MKEVDEVEITAGAAFSLLIAFVAFVVGLCFEETFFGVTDLVLSPITKRVPDMFVVAEDFDIPTHQVTAAVPSTVTSFVGLLEATYRQQGIARGYLETHELVQFSDEAFARTLRALCSSEDSPSYCKSYDGAFELNRLMGPTIAYFLESFGGLSRSIVPASVCEDIECDALSDYLAKNPLSFRVENVEWAKSVRDIKEMMYRARQPVILSIPNPEMLYRVNNSYVSYMPMTLSGEFFSPRKPATLGIGQPISLLVYGWNDGFVPAYGTKPLKSVGQPKGGFIVKGMSKRIGHSIPFLASDVASADDSFHCGNGFDALTWRSISVLKNNRSEVSDKYILTCINETFCSKTAEYALVRIKFDKNPLFFKEQENGITSIKIMKFENGEGNIIDFDALPLHMLHLAFRPKVLEENDDSVCGYWFIPYELIEQLDRTGNDVFNRVAAMSFNISWNEDSFAGQSDNEKYAEVTKSMRNISKRIKTRDSLEMIKFYSQLYQQQKDRFSLF